MKIKVSKLLQFIPGSALFELRLTGLYSIKLFSRHQYKNTLNVFNVITSLFMDGFSKTKYQIKENDEFYTLAVIQFNKITL